MAGGLVGLKVIQNSYFLSPYPVFSSECLFFLLGNSENLLSSRWFSPKEWKGKNNPYKPVGFQNKFRIEQVNLWHLWQLSWQESDVVWVECYYLYEEK